MKKEEGQGGRGVVTETGTGGTIVIERVIERER